MPRRRKKRGGGQGQGQTPREPATFVSTPSSAVDDPLKGGRRGEGNGNGRGVDDARVEQYSTPSRQAELRALIEGQALPVRERMHELTDGLEECLTRKGILLLQGETGSGKSVYSPVAMRRVLTKLGMKDRTVMMQPRRDATQDVALATAAVMGERIGDGVGFSTSEAKAARSSNAVTVVTGGIFVRYLREGALSKERVGAVILDEIHEGSKETHLAMGLLRMAQEQGDAPLMLLTSATMDKDRLQAFYGIDYQDYLRIEGRAHPVDVSYETLREQQNEQRRERSYIERAAAKAQEVCAKEGGGDILIFMPGAKEIRETIRRIGNIQGVEVLPYFGTLTPEERKNARSGKKPPGVQRRIIVATNAAETSITIPGVTVVIDSCCERSVRYNPATGIQERGTAFISQDQAEQRAGRAGRITAGRCYRLVTEEQFARFKQHPESEMSRSNLANEILTLKAMSIDPQEFPFYEPPPQGSIDGALKELQLLGAFDEEGNVNTVGQEMARMTLEPRRARMVVEAKKRGCAEAAIILCAFEREHNVLLGPTHKEEQDAPGYDDRERRRNARASVQRTQNVFDRGGSDILKALNIFSTAIEQGVFEASRRRDTPESKAAWKKFEAWCKEYHLKAQALTHIAYKIADYARDAGVRINYDTLKQKLQDANDEDLGSVILAGHTDRILYSHRSTRGLPSYGLLTGSRSQEINMSPGSEAADLRPQLSVATNITQGSGTSKGAAITRNYAEGVHPIGLRQLQEVASHLIQERSGDPRYNPALDRVEATVTLQPKGVSGIELGSEDRVIEGEKAVRAFAQALVNNRVQGMECIQRNVETGSQLERLYNRSRGQVPKMEDLVSWYVEHLQGAHTQSDAKYLDDQLTLQLEEFYPPELQQEVDTLYPEQVSIADRLYDVTYSFRAENKTWRELERFTATVTIDSEQIFALTESDIPTIGPADSPVQLTLQSKAGRQMVDAQSLLELKDTLDASRIESAWSTWEEKPEPEQFDTEFGVALPSVADLGKAPLEFTQTWKGESVFAYPAVSTYSGATFRVVYYATEEGATRATEAAQRAKEGWDAAEQIRQDRETLAEPAKAKLKELQPRVMEIHSDYERFGFTNDGEYELQRNFEQADRLLTAQDRWGDDHSDPRKALEMLEAIEQTIADMARTLDERDALLPEAGQAIQALEPIANEALHYDRYRSYGLSEEEYGELSRKWERAKKLVRATTGDVREALTLLQEVRHALDRLEVREWASPAALAFKEVRDSRSGGIYAKIIIRDGQMLDSQGNATSSLNIGGSGRSLVARRGSDRRVRLQTFYGSGNSMFRPMSLPDGSYAISRDAGDFFRVEFDDAGEVVHVYDRVTPEDMDEPDLVVQTAPPPRHDAGWGYDEPVRTVAGPEHKSDGFRTLGAALDGLNLSPQQPPPVEPAIAADSEPEQAQSKPAVEAPPRVEEELTPELRQGFQDELTFIQVLVTAARALGRRPKKETDKKGKPVELTSTQKALELIHSRALKVEGILRDVRQLLTDEDETRVAVVRSRIGSAHVEIERAVKSGAKFLVGDTFDNAWATRLEERWREIDQLVDNDSDAREFIKEGLATREDIIGRLQERLQSNGTDFMRGNDSDFGTALEEILADF